MPDIRLAFVVIPFLLASCTCQDARVSRIQGDWTSTATGRAVNRIDFTIDQDENTVSGIGDVKEAIYEFDGTWTGSFGAEDALDMELTLSDVEGKVSGTGTLSTGAQDVEVTIVGTHAGNSFQFGVHPAVGEPLQVSGHFEYGLKGILLTVEIDNIPASADSGERRDLQLTIHGKRSGGLLNLFPSDAGSSASGN